MMKKLLYALLPLALCLMGSGSAQAQTTQTEEINVQRGLGLGYSATDFSDHVDFTTCKSFLGITDVNTEATLVLINSENQEVTPTWGGGTPDGWCDENGNLVGWIPNGPSKICVKFIPDQNVYTICDMNGADIDGETYSVRYGLKANDKTYIFIINVIFADDPTASEFLSNLTVIDGPEVVCEEMTRSGWAAAKPYSVNISSAIEALGVTPNNLQSNLQNMLFTTSNANPAKVIKTKSSAGTGWWYEVTNAEDDSSQCGNSGIDGKGQFWALDFAFDGTNNLNFGVGQAPGLKELSSYYAYVYIINDSKAYRIKIIVNVLEDPANHPLLTDLNITEGPEIVVTQERKNDWSHDTKTVDISEALNVLELSQEDLAAEFQSKLFTTDYSNTAKLIKTKNTTYAGWWYTPINAQVKGESATNGMDGSNFFVEEFTLSETEMSFNIGQNANNIPAVGDSYFAYIYIVNGNKAYRVKITLNIKPYDITLNETDEANARLNELNGQMTTVTLVRTFYPGWNTLVLPFDISMADLAGKVANVVEIGTYQDDENDENGYHIHFKKEENGVTLTANTPALIYLADEFNENYVNNTITIENARLNVVESLVAEGTNFDFVGTYVQGELIGDNDYYVGKENSFWKSGKARTTKGYRAFLKAKSATGAPARIAFDFGDGTATAIDTLDGEQLNAGDGAWYTLSGVRIAAPAHRGLYIKNGKKYFVK